MIGLLACLSEKRNFYSDHPVVILASKRVNVILTFTPPSFLIVLHRQINKHRHCCHGNRNMSQASANFSSSFFLSFTSYRGPRLRLHKWAVLTNILGSAGHSSLSSPRILASNHYSSSENGVFRM